MRVERCDWYFFVMLDLLNGFYFIVVGFVAGGDVCVNARFVSFERFLRRLLTRFPYFFFVSYAVLCADFVRFLPIRSFKDNGDNGAAFPFDFIHFTMVARVFPGNGDNLYVLVSRVDDFFMVECWLTNVARAVAYFNVLQTFLRGSCAYGLACAVADFLCFLPPRYVFFIIRICLCVAVVNLGCIIGRFNCLFLVFFAVWDVFACDGDFPPVVKVRWCVIYVFTGPFNDEFSKHFSLIR